MFARARGQLLVERWRRHRARRVVRIVDPEDRAALPRLVVDGVEVGKPRVLLTQRNEARLRAGELRAPLVDRIRGLGDDDDVLPRAARDEREEEDRLLRAVGRDQLALGIDLGAEPSRQPTGDGATQLGQPGARG